MGISKFVKFLFKYQTPSYSVPKTQAEILYFDLNSLLHDCATYVFAYGPYKDRYSKEDVDYFNSHPEELEQEYLSTLIQMVEEIINYVQPQKTWIGIDGVCPVAKIQQQRWRRFKSKKESPFDFSSVMISPGTHFMKKIHDHLANWATKKNVIFDNQTSYLTPGEAEHKIMQDVMKRKGTFIIYGLDNDLVILSLLHSNDKLSLWNMKREFDNNSYYFVDSLQMKKNILQSMGTNATIEDFCFLSFFIGNDFFPAVFGYDLSSSDTLDILINMIYAPFKPSSKPLIKNLEIQWKNVKEFLLHLLGKESIIYNKQIGLHSVIQNSIHKNVIDLELLRINYDLYVNNHLDDEYVKVNFDQRKSIASTWFKTVEWNLNYYLQNKVSNDFFYTSYHGPSIQMLLDHFPSGLELEQNYFEVMTPTPFLSIPLQMACILPKKYKKYVIDQQMFEQFIQAFPQWFPKRIRINRDGLDESSMYKEKMILPLIQPSLVRRFKPEEKTVEKKSFQLIFEKFPKQTQELLKKFDTKYEGEDEKQFFEKLKNKSGSYGTETKRGSKRAKDVFEQYKKCSSTKVDSYLDVGCNQGENTVEIKNIFGLKESQTFGVDVKSFSGREIKPISGFQHQFYDGVNLPFAKNKFDLVSVLQVLHHVEKVDEFMKSLYDVVKPNGVVVLREHDCNGDQEVIDLEHLMWSAQEVSYEEFKKSYYSKFFSKQELIELFQKNGFEVCNHTKPFGPTSYYYISFVKKHSVKNMYKGALLHVHFSAMVRTKTVLDHLFKQQEPFFWDRKKKMLSFLPQGVQVKPEMRSEIEQYIQSAWKIHDDFDRIGNMFYEIIKFDKFYPQYVDLIYQEMLEQNIDLVELRLKLGGMFGKNKKYSIEEEMKILLEKQHELWTRRESKSISIIAQNSKHKSQEEVMEYFKTIHTILEKKPQYKSLIVAFDIVGDERKGNSLAKFQDVLNTEFSVPFVLHAGEIKGKKGLDNLRIALPVSKRIGHGHHIVDDKELMKYKVCLELCPISNEMLGNSYLEAYEQIIEAGIPFTINSDDPNRFEDKDLNDNFQWMLDHGFTIEQLELAVKNSIKFSLSGKKYYIRQ